MIDPSIALLSSRRRRPVRRVHKRHGDGRKRASERDRETSFYRLRVNRKNRNCCPMSDPTPPRNDVQQDDTAKPAEPPKRSGRGFASMTPEQRRQLGSRGGKTAHERGTANRFTSESASQAGRIPHEKGTAYKWTSELAAQAGRKGGSTPRRTRTSKPPPKEG
jgi:uncharacterized protein